MEELLKSLGITVTGSAAVVLAIWKLFGRKFYNFVKTSIQEYLDLKKEHAAVMEVMSTLAKELKPNGGTSIKDSINRIERNVNFLSERQKTLVSIQELAVFEADPKGSCLYVNRYYCDLTGLTQEEALGNGWVNALHPDDRDAAFLQWNKAVEQKREFILNYRFINSNNIINVFCHAYPLKDSKTGDIISYIGSIRVVNNANLQTA